MYLILILGLLVTANSYAVNFPNSTNYIVNGCRILGPDEVERKILPGERCIFFDNGDFISSTMTTIRYYTSKNEVKWELKGLFHHQMNLSSDQRRILVLGSVHGSTRHDSANLHAQLNIVGIDGQIERSLDFSAALEQFRLQSHAIINSNRDPVPVNQQGIHLNSFYEIPAIKDGVKVPSYIQPGNFVINGLVQGVFIIDKDLKKIIGHWVSPFSVLHNIHDAQVTAAGKLIYFNNMSAHSRLGNTYSSVDEVDLMSNKRILEVKTNPAGLFYSPHCGGVQVINNDLVLFSHVVAGYHVYSREKKSIIFSSHAPYLRGAQLTAAQQIKQYDLTNFLKQR